VHLRITKVAGDRFRAVRPLNGKQPFGGFIERLIPRDFAPGITFATHRSTQSVGILVHVLECERLGANVASAKGIGVIAAYRDDLVAAMADFDPAHCFAQVAGPMVYREGV
jgi:hypothetical protein